MEDISAEQYKAQLQQFMQQINPKPSKEEMLELLEKYRQQQKGR